jgi:hypothetical protein
MKTNNGWIKTDYHVQTIIGSIIALLTVASVLLWFSVAQFAFATVYFAVLLLIPLGVWQVISGIVGAFDNDRLQQIYIGVIIIYFGIWYFISAFSLEFYSMLAIALIIAVWKYTVVRADFISLRIIDMSKIENDSLLDA